MQATTDKVAANKPTTECVGGPIGFNSCRMIGRCLIQFYKRKVNVRSFKVKRSCNHAGLSVSPERHSPALSHTHTHAENTLTHINYMSIPVQSECVSSID